MQYFYFIFILFVTKTVSTVRTQRHTVKSEKNENNIKKKLKNKCGGNNSRKKPTTIPLFTSKNE